MTAEHEEQAIDTSNAQEPRPSAIPRNEGTTVDNSTGTTRIRVPKRTCQGGLNEKFETDPYDVKLYGLMTANEYTDAITILNETIKPARAKKLDVALLATGALMVVPVVVWGVRHGAQQKKRKRLLTKGIEDFNAKYPHLYMRWNRRPVSSLTIERRKEDLHGAPPPPASVATDSGALVPVTKTQAYFEYQMN